MTPKLLIFLINVILIAGCLGGCQTTSLVNTYTRRDGTISETKFITNTVSSPFGKQNLAAGNMKTTFGSGTIETGQNAEGIDNTAQGSALQAILAWAMKYAASKAGTAVVDEVSP